MKELRPETQKIWFLVKNYPYGLIPGYKFANLGQNMGKYKIMQENQGK